MRWRRRVPIDIWPPLNKDSETASYPAPSSSTAMSSRGLDPTPLDQVPVAADADIRHVLVCNEGHSSRFAAR